ncbi:MAG: acyl carrier protein [Pseudomonadota bacterium]
MSDEMNTIQTTILDFVCQELIAEDMSVAVDDDLLSGEILDSLAVLRLATFVDQEFSIGMQPTDFVIENFQTVAVLSSFVARCIETRS